MNLSRLDREETLRRAKELDVELDMISLEQLEDRASKLGVNAIMLAELYGFKHALDLELEHVRLGKEKRGVVNTIWSLFMFLEKLSLLGYINTNVAQNAVNGIVSLAKGESVTLDELTDKLREYGSELVPGPDTLYYFDEAH